MSRIDYDKIQGLLSSARAGSLDAINTLKQQDIFKNAKASDVLAALKLTEIVKEDEKKKKVNVVLVVLAVIGAIAAIAAICYGLYCYFTPEYLDDFDDDFEDELDEDFFEDEEDEEE